MSRLWVLLSPSFPSNFPLSASSLSTPVIIEPTLLPTLFLPRIHDEVPYYTLSLTMYYMLFFFRPFRCFGDINWHIGDAILGVITRQWHGLGIEVLHCLSVRFYECQFRFLIERIDYMIHYTWNLSRICPVHTDELKENKTKNALKTHYIIH